MTALSVPTRDQVTEGNQAIFDQLQGALGFVPNLYAYYAKNENSLGAYLSFANRKSTLSKKTKEAINLVVSEVNGCDYCLSAHTVLGKMNGFSDDEILEIRSGSASFDARLDGLVRFAKEVASHNGQISESSRTDFFESGWSEADLVEVVVSIGEKTISNYLHNITQIDIDFPVASPLEEALVNA